MNFKFKSSYFVFQRFEKSHGTLLYVFTDERGEEVKIEYQQVFNMLKQNELELL